MAYNIIKLTKEITNLGLPCTGIYDIDGNGENIGFNWSRELSTNETQQLSDILNNHDPINEQQQSVEEQIAELQNQITILSGTVQELLNV